MKKPVYLPILKTDEEKETYFREIVKNINDKAYKESRELNLNSLESFIKSNRWYSNLRMFRRKHGTG